VCGAAEHGYLELQAVIRLKSSLLYVSTWIGNVLTAAVY